MDSLADVPALILAGGLGTRLRPALADRPKVLAPVRGRPFLAYLLDQLAVHGVRRAVLCTGYGADQVRAVLGDHHGPIELAYSVETEPLGTAGALALALPLAAGDWLLALNGDSFCAADLTAFRQWHARKGAAASLVLARVADTSRYGQVEIEDHDRVVRFAEKAASSGPGWINAGIYLLPRRVLERVPAGQAVSLERDVFPGLVGRGLHGYPGGGRFLDIGTPESLSQAEAFFAPRRYVVLDRDGTIIVERNYLADPAGVELLPGTGPGLRQLAALGLGLVVVTNQSGVGRGYFDEDRLEQVHRRLRELLAAEGVTLDGIYHCPHVPEDACSCRKPRPGLLHRAASVLGFEPRQCIVIGDKACEIELGQAVGARTVLVRTGYGAEVEAAGQVRPDHVVADLAEAAEVIRTIV